MRVNVYAEEMTDRLEIIGKEIDGHNFTGLRFYLELPATVGGVQHQAPFMHRPGDDDSSAVTFWGKRDLRQMLHKASNLLDEHYAKYDAGKTLTAPITTKSAPSTNPPAPGEYWPGQGGRYICTMPATMGLPARHLIAADGEGEDLTYGPYMDVPGAASLLDGAANTLALLATGKTHPAAQWCADFTADGHTDFFLPARVDMVMAHAFAPQLFNKRGWYITSTQVARFHAFAQDFEYGLSDWVSKDHEFRVRAFRAIPLDPLST